MWYFINSQIHWDELVWNATLLKQSADLSHVFYLSFIQLYYRESKIQAMYLFSFQ